MLGGRLPGLFLFFFFLLFDVGLEFLLGNRLGSGMIIPGGWGGRYFPVDKHQLVPALYDDGGLRPSLGRDVLYEVGVGILSAIDGNQNVARSQACVPGRGPFGHKSLHRTVPVAVLDKSSPHQVEGGRSRHGVAGGAEIEGASRPVQPELAGNQGSIAQDDVNVVWDAHYFRIGKTLA